MVVIDVLIQNKLDEIKKLKEEAKLKGYKYIENDDKNWTKISRIITCWYEFKYPKDIIRINNYDNPSIVSRLSEFDVEKVEQLSKYMTYSELMNRIPKELHHLIECWYRDKDGKINDYISGNIYTKNTNMKSGMPFTIYNRDGCFEEIDNLFTKYMLFHNSLEIDYMAAVINKDTYDLTEMNNIIDVHNTDLELRRLNLEYIALKLLKHDLKSNNDILIGYIRAKNFIIDFNQGVDCLLLKENILPTLNYLNLEDYEELINKITKSGDGEFNIDTFGLKFETIQFLKKQGINNLTQLHNKNIYNIKHGDGITNFKIGKRDISILNDMITLADEKYDDHIKNLLNITNESNVKVKKKSIFSRKNKQK